MFHIRPPLKQSACVPYLEVLVLGNFNNCLLRRSHIEYFSSQEIFSWLVDLNYLLTCIFQLITHVCYFHESSTSYLLIADLRNSPSCISYTKRRERLCILFIWLFEVLLAEIILASDKYFVCSLDRYLLVLVKALNLLFARLHIFAICFVKVSFSSMVIPRSFTSLLHFICLFSIANF